MDAVRSQSMFPKSFLKAKTTSTEMYEKVCHVLILLADESAFAPLLSDFRFAMPGSARSESENIGDKTRWLSRYKLVEKKKHDALCVVQDRVFNTQSMLNAYAGNKQVCLLLTFSRE